MKALAKENISADLLFKMHSSTQIVRLSPSLPHYLPLIRVAASTTLTRSEQRLLQTQVQKLQQNTEAK
eukprot:c16906_g1_i1 orf=372-575(+)